MAHTITTKPRVARYYDRRTNSMREAPHRLDYVCCDDEVIGYRNPEPVAPVILLGVAPESVIQALRDHFGQDTVIAQPGVLIDRKGRPVKARDVSRLILPEELRPDPDTADYETEEYGNDDD